MVWLQETDWECEDGRSPPNNSRGMGSREDSAKSLNDVYAKHLVHRAAISLVVNGNSAHH